MARAIEIEALGKHYVLGGRAQSYSTLRESLSLLGRRGRNDDQGIWALRDVNLAVEEGEVLGVIGPNGAGKTTLLKILTRITQPTTGVTRTRGRVGALLEVGTGFHPELTGRENVYLNGAILGMRQREIRRKFDEIVSFAEVERFIDTPVKRYSSGMHMRLAFAVAAHLEPDVLIVDEVLAVGDAAFQKRSLGKMDEVAQTGRTVLFVSHNMPAIESLCSSVVWMNSGRMVERGAPARVIRSYLDTTFASTLEREWNDQSAAPGDARVRLRRVGVRGADGTPPDRLTIRTPLLLEFEYWNSSPGACLSLSFHIYNEDGILAVNAAPGSNSPARSLPRPRGLIHERCFLPGDLLNDGRYRLELLVVENDSNVLLKVSDALAFTLFDSPDMRGAWYGEWQGVLRPLLDWTVDPVREAPSGAADGGPA